MATAPAAAALESLIALPAKKADPPFEHWMMTGEFAFIPASMTALHVDELVQLNAGMA